MNVGLSCYTRCLPRIRVLHLEMYRWALGNQVALYIYVSLSEYVLCTFLRNPDVHPFLKQSWDNRKEKKITGFWKGFCIWGNALSNCVPLSTIYYHNHFIFLQWFCTWSLGSVDNKKIMFSEIRHFFSAYFLCKIEALGWIYLSHIGNPTCCDPNANEVLLTKRSLYQRHRAELK